MHFQSPPFWWLMTTQLRLTSNTINHFEFNHIVELPLNMCIFQDRIKNGLKWHLHILKELPLYHCICGVHSVRNINVMHVKISQQQSGNKHYIKSWSSQRALNSKTTLAKQVMNKSYKLKFSLGIPHIPQTQSLIFPQALRVQGSKLLDAS
jgi:hypothetical protein